jgi:hypothetical protein
MKKENVTYPSPEAINEALKDLKEGKTDLGVGIRPIVAELLEDVRDNFNCLQDIHNTLEEGKELDATQQGWLDAYVKSL